VARAKITSFNKHYHAIRHYARALTNPYFRQELETLGALLDLAYEVARESIEVALLGRHGTNKGFDISLREAIRALEFYIKVLEYVDGKVKELFRTFLCERDFYWVVDFDIEWPKYAAEGIIDRLRDLRKATKGWLSSSFTKGTRRWLNKQVYYLIEDQLNHLRVTPIIILSDNFRASGFVADEARESIRYDREFRTSLGAELWVNHLFTWLFGGEKHG